jgi:plasmid replication initiation protein
MNHQNLTVYKANQVVEAGYRLSLNEQRVVLACIAQVDSKEALLVTDQFELSAKDFAKIFSVSDDRAYHALIEVAESLFNRYVIIDKPFPDRPRINRLKTRWISTIYYMTDDGKICLTFAKDMLPYLSELKGQFTKYELKHIGNMTSIYGIRLYELLMQWKTTGTRTIEIDWLKKQFEIDEQYAAMKDLKKRVIDPAVKDINTHSNYQVSWEQRKTGRNVTHLTFTFAEKQPLIPEKPKRVTKPKEKMYYGVPKSEIDKVARTGETYEDAAARINREKAANKTPKTPAPITAVPVGDYIAKTWLIKPQPATPKMSPTYQDTRLDIIKFNIDKHGKEKYLAEFKEKGFATMSGISSVILDVDLRAAGLFD